MTKIDKPISFACWKVLKGTAPALMSGLTQFAISTEVDAKILKIIIQIAKNQTKYIEDAHNYIFE